MKKKVVAMVLTLTMAVGMLTGCSGPENDTAAGSSKDAGAEAGKSGEKKDGDLLVYGIYKAGDQTWFIDEGDAAKAAVEAAGGEFVYVDAKMNPEEYLKAIDNAIANNAAGIVTCPPDQTMSQARGGGG